MSSSFPLPSIIIQWHRAPPQPLTVHRTRLYSVISYSSSSSSRAYMQQHSITTQLVNVGRLQEEEANKVNEVLKNNGCTQFPLLARVTQEELATYGITQREHVKAVLDVGFAEILRFKLLDLGLSAHDADECANILVKEGCNTMQLFKSLTEELLREVGISDHTIINCIIRGVQDMKNTAASPVDEMTGTGGIVPPAQLTRTVSVPFSNGELCTLLIESGKLAPQDASTCAEILLRERVNTIKLYTTLTRPLLLSIGITNEQHIQGILASITKLKGGSNVTTSPAVVAAAAIDDAQKNDRTPAMGGAKIPSDKTRKDLVILDVVGSRPNIDLGELATNIKSVKHEGLESWGDSKQVSSAFGGKKLVMSVILKPWLISIDGLCDIITDAFGDALSSIDVAARSPMDG